LPFHKSKIREKLWWQPESGFMNLWSKLLRQPNSKWFLFSIPESTFVRPHPEIKIKCFLDLLFTCFPA
jgi:hypothetical protein